jgi:hypothetical protein
MMMRRRRRRRTTTMMWTPELGKYYREYESCSHTTESVNYFELK